MTSDEWAKLPLMTEDRARSMAKRFTSLYPVDGSFGAAEMAAKLAERHGAVIFGKGGTVELPILYGSYEGNDYPRIRSEDGADIPITSIRVVKAG